MKGLADVVAPSKHHWLFRFPCGCAFSVATKEHHPTELDAWRGTYEYPAEELAARREGVTAELITHEAWVNKHSDEMMKGGGCTHRPDPDPITQARVKAAKAQRGEEFDQAVFDMAVDAQVTVAIERIMQLLHKPVDVQALRWWRTEVVG